MTGQVAAQSIINGLCLGWIYILIAAGLSLIFGVMNILQFAHGEVYMLGAYVVYSFSVILGLDFFVALLISMASMLVLGLILERTIFRYLRGEFLVTLIVALGLMMILQSSVAIGFGISHKVIPSFYPHVVDILGVKMGGERLIAVGISVAAILGLYFMLKRTRLGQALTASAQHPDASRLMGINPNVMAAAAMAIGSALAGVAGGLMGSIFYIAPDIGGAAIIKALIIIIVGGKGNLLGVIVAGILLGLIDAVAPVFFGPAVAAIAPLFILAIIVVIRPQGLFGYEL